MNDIILIGGSPCSGKSTVAELISKEFGCDHVRIDDYMHQHIENSNASFHPIMYKWKTSPWHELFSQDVNQQFKEEVAFYFEEWAMLKNDLFNDLKKDKVVIEGCGLLPSKMSELNIDATIVYMIPSKEFQVKMYQKRTWAFDLLKDAEDPQLAFNNWMQRDMLYAEYIKSEAKAYGYPVLVVDGEKDIIHQLNWVINQST